MKKIQLLLSIAMLILCSCGNSLSPSTYPPVISYVAKKARKYNNGLSDKAIMNKAGLSINSASNEGNLVRALKAAFDGFMPELKGQRKYGGVYTLPTITGSISEEAKSALTWLVSYGLWGEEAFDETAIVSEETFETILERFYMYIGTHEEDDFFAYHNHDFLYEDSDDVDVSPDDYYYKFVTANKGAVEDNALAFTKELMKKNSSETAFYQQTLAYYDGTLDYAFLEDPLIKEHIENIEAIGSLTEWLSYAGESLQTWGGNALVSFDDAEFEYNEDYSLFAYLTCSPGNSALYQSTTDPTSEAKEISLKAFQKLGLSNTLSTTYSDAFSSFTHSQWTNYYSDDSKDDREVPAYLYDSSSQQDIYQKSGITIDLTDVFLSAGYSTEEMSLTRTDDAAGFLSLGKALLTASTAELQALALYNFSSLTLPGSEYQEGTPADWTYVLPLLENNLAYDYMQSDYYANCYNTINTMSKGIQSVFAARLTSSPWLSVEGRLIAKDKLSNISSTMLGTSSDGSTIPYKDMCLESGLSLSATFGAQKYKTKKQMLKMMAAGASLDSLNLLNWGPFLPNAFYSPLDNSINVTFGTVFTLGLNLSGLSQEALYGLVGQVLAHEITHGFDKGGMKWDKNGKRVEEGIVPEADMAAFATLTTKLEALYEGQEILPGLSQNPDLTIEECLADQGGIFFMEDLGKRSSSFDFKEFYHYAAREPAMKFSRFLFTSRLLNDVHSSGRVRTNVPLRNSALFQKTFAIKEGDGMYQSPSLQVVIW